MTSTRLSTLQDVQKSLIRKALNMSVFIADHSADTIDETTLFDATTGDIKTLPAGYHDLGSTTTDGADFSRSISTSKVTTLQSLAPARIDATEDEITMQVTCDETKLATMGLVSGAALSGITADANGVVRVDKPKDPAKRNWRVFAIAEDVNDSGSIFVCRYIPNGLVTSYGGQKFARGDDPIQTQVTFTAQYDDDDATDHSWIWGGVGWKALLADMGLSDESSSSSSSA